MPVFYRANTISNIMIGTWIVGIATVVLLFVWFWRINTIHCVHTSRECTDKELSILESVRGRRVLFFGMPVSAEQELANAGVKMQRWHINWPATLSVTLVEQKRSLVFRTSNDAQSWIVTDDWLLLPILAELSTPPLLVDQAVLTAWQIDKHKLQAEVPVLISILEAIKQWPIQSVEVRADDSCVLKLEKMQLIMLLSSWQIALQRWEMLEKNFDWNRVVTPIVEVDLRYELPVLRNTITLPRHN